MAIINLQFDDLLSLEPWDVVAALTNAAMFAVGNSEVRGYLSGDEINKSATGQLYAKVDHARVQFLDYGKTSDLSYNAAKSGSIITRWPGYPGTGDDTTILAQIPRISNLIQGLDPAKVSVVPVFLGGGINDLSAGLSATNLAGYVREAIAKIKAIPAPAGIEIRVIPLTILPSAKASSAGVAQTEAQRLAYNKDVVANFRDWGAYNLVNFGANSRLNNPLDTAYFNATDFENGGPDHQHPNTTGYGVMADDMLPVLLATIDGIYLTPPDTIDSTSNDGSGAGSDYTPSNLVPGPVTMSNDVLQTTYNGSTATATLVNASNPNPYGYSGGIQAKDGIGNPNDPDVVVWGWYEWRIWNDAGENVTGIYPQASRPADLASYEPITYAFHQQPAQGVRAFGVGTGSLAGQTNNFKPFANGSLVRLVKERDRIVWYLNGKQIAAYANTDPSAFFLETVFKGQGSYITDLKIAAVIKVDSGRDAYVGSNLSAARRVLRASNVVIDTQAGTVSWNDQSGNGDVFRSSTPNRTTLIPNAINGLPAVKLTSTTHNEATLVGYIPPGLRGSAPFYYFAVVQVPTDSASNELGLLSLGNDIGDGNGIPTGQIADLILQGGTLKMHFGGSLTSGSATPVNTNQWKIVGGYWDGTKGATYTGADGWKAEVATHANMPNSALKIMASNFDGSDGNFGSGTASYAAVVLDAFDQTTMNADLATLKADFGL